VARQREFDKEDVLQRAITVFWAKGYEATSIRDLKDAMGISSSSMYEVFGDKRGVFLAALAKYCEMERAQIDEMAQQAPSPQAFVKQLFASVKDVVHQGQHTNASMAFNVMVEFGTRDTRVTDLLLAHYFGIADIIARVIEQGQATKIISNTEMPRQIAFTILSTLHGMATITGIKADFADLDAVTRLTIQLLNHPHLTTEN